MLIHCAKEIIWQLSKFLNTLTDSQAENCILNILWQMDGQAFIETFVIKRYFKMKSTWFSPILGTVPILQNRIVQPGSLMYEFWHKFRNSYQLCKPSHFYITNMIIWSEYLFLAGCLKSIHIIITVTPPTHTHILLFLFRDKAESCHEARGSARLLLTPRPQTFVAFHIGPHPAESLSTSACRRWNVHIPCRRAQKVVSAHQKQATSGTRQILRFRFFLLLRNLR